MDDRMKTHGAVGWCDLMTDDVDKARDFYTGVIGWDTEVMDVGKGGPYTVFKTGGRPVAGLMAKPPEGPAADCPDHVDVLRDGRRCRCARRQGRGRGRHGVRRPDGHPDGRTHGDRPGSHGGVIGIIKYENSDPDDCSEHQEG